MLPLSWNHRLPYLGFQWEIGCVTHYFCFAVLPFGLSTASFIFTKVCRHLVKWWRFHGIRIVLYLNDDFSTTPSRLQSLKNSVLVKNSLIKVGFLPNGEKSVWIPTQNCEWLGMIFNAVDKTLSLPEDRILSLVFSIESVLDTSKVYLILFLLLQQGVWLS